MKKGGAVRYSCALLWIVGGCLSLALAASVARAQEGVDDVAWKKLVEPSLVTLDLKEATWRETYEKLAEVSGNTLKLPERTSSTTKPVTLSLQDVPFWKAVALLNKVAPANFNADYDQPVFSVRDSFSATEYPFAACVGPVEISVRSFQALREAAYDWSFGGGTSRNRGPSVQLSICVSIEPRVRVASAVVRFDEARDDTGKDLLALPGGGRGGSGSVRIHGPRRAVRDYAQVALALPAAQATRIKQIRGSLELGIIPPAEPVRVMLDNPGKELSLLGYPVTYASVSGDEKLGWQVTFKAASWPRSSTMSDTRGMQLADADGKTLDYKGFGFRPSDGSRPGTPRFSPGGPVDIHFRFAWQADFKPAALILPSAVPPRMHSFPFEFSDIPLPPLTAAYASANTAAAAVLPDAPMPPAPDSVLPMEQLAASSFSLAAQGMPPADVAAEITRQTGNSVVWQKHGPRRGEEEPTVTLHLENVPFWKGLEEMCRPGAISLSYSGYEKDRRVQMGKRTPMRGEGIAPVPSQVVGAVRYVISRVAVTAESKAEYTAKPYLSDKFTLTASVNAWVEPKIQIQQQSGRVIECVTGVVAPVTDTPAGPDTPRYTHTQPPPVPDPRAAHITDSTRNSIANIWLSVPLTSGQVPARIARLRAYHYVQLDPKSLPADAARVLEWNDIAPGAAFDAGQGLKIVYEQMPGTPLPNRLVPRREGGASAVDIELLKKGLAAYDAAGHPIKLSPVMIGNEANWCLALPKDAAPARAALTLSAHPGIYAGVVEFRDIPVPSLPAMAVVEELEP